MFYKLKNKLKSDPISNKVFITIPYNTANTSCSLTGLTVPAFKTTEGFSGYSVTI